MLQQTQVSTVVPYFNRFVRRFATVKSLAAAELDDVLRLWAGLGYYSRARNLHKAARIVVEQFGGKFPNDPELLRTLPGVGRYTTGAISSIAFGMAEPVVDGNVKRVLTRVLNIHGDVSDKRVEESLWDKARELLPAERCGDFNQAMMELGATVCLPGREANCESCPISTLCKGLSAGAVHELPYKSARTKVENETHVVVAIRSGDKWMFVRRPPDGLWGGLWEMPSVVGISGHGVTAARRLANRTAGGNVTVEPIPFCTVTHQLTHRKIEMIGYRCKTTGTRARRNGAKWIRLNGASSLGISRAMKLVLQHLKEHIR
jgi:A/G-specific adenine glycosylase